MKEKYTFQVEANVGKVVPSVGETFDEINKTMKNFGFGGKLSAHSVITTGTITANRKLTTLELSKMRNIIEDNYNKIRPDWDISITWD